MVSLFGGFSGGFVVWVVFSRFVGGFKGSNLFLLNLTGYKCGFEVFLVSMCLLNYLIHLT